MPNARGSMLINSAKKLFPMLRIKKRTVEIRRAVINIFIGLFSIILYEILLLYVTGSLSLETDT